MKKGLMLIVLVAGLCGITKAQAQVEEVIMERMLSLPNIPHRQNLKTRLLLCLSWL